MLVVYLMLVVVMLAVRVIVRMRATKLRVV